MARTNVITTPMFKYKRKTPSGDIEGWGNVAVRKATTVATSPKLLRYRGCVASEMAGQSGSLGEIQRAFRKAADKCS